MDDTFVRLWGDLADRLTGPMTFRIVLQPAMAAFYAIRDGLKDARERRPPYFRTMLSHPDQRGRLLREGASAVGRVVLLGIVMDVVYQLMVLGRIYPGELVIVVALLAVVPYLLVRGPANLIARHTRHSPTVADHGR